MPVYHAESSVAVTVSGRIHRLPLEVLARMFKFYVGKDEQDNSFDPTYEVFPLGAVCKTWRYTAWTTPSLWTRLRFKFGSRTTESKVQLAMGWLMRSGVLPLDVYLSATESTETIILPLVDLVNRLLYRCRFLILSNLTYLAQSRFSPPSRSSILEILRIIPLTITSPLYLGPNVAPKDLCILGYYVNLLDINWGNLTTVEGLEVCLIDVFHVINMAPQLVSFRRVYVHMDSSLPPDGYKQITHSKLQNLMIESHEDSESEADVALDTFFRTVSLPSLIDCCTESQCYPFPSAAFCSFLSRSSCSIQELDIYTASIETDVLIEIAKASPNVRNFSLEFPPHTGVPEVHRRQSNLGPFYDALVQVSETTGSYVLFPHLQKFSICADAVFPWKNFPRICRRTNLKGICISVLKGYEDPDFFPSSWELFAELLELNEARNFDIKYGNRSLLEQAFHYLKSSGKEYSSDLVDRFAKTLTSFEDE
ncbi:hypothetical protein JR316_0011074 [Psilocybe cubensis]|uniref:Uncharacterized protein n=2 Tax=Psilocybe cubensis TaxID=181762 RepID=A0ACB8GP18_PSICU|nr:hypothetical protein JR316_0011074 [Psilocybe cubensis]KAH9477157.1 hypothetical protein JR316_0011074 [Psilocybe cubensis]